MKKEQIRGKKSVHWLDSDFFFVQECLMEQGRLQHFLQNQAGLKSPAYIILPVPDKVDLILSEEREEQV